ncbi:conserved uncharacterized mitochondrial protein [Andalucia godoyi]|uniref:Conserved uncharacterized mitochondrial protein n=1 Tax=Andalucia godoyi TaxID=505711 RepID=A0A8K0F2C6_ANDGO|nr:conserved uncharacterized mitochondrial protein [Andalucia godoyi]|eukprot:ANDGO_04107.mRNA.1 conserved uncharacterized mitochondrial protein
MCESAKNNRIPPLGTFRFSRLSCKTNWDCVVMARGSRKAAAASSRRRTTTGKLSRDQSGLKSKTAREPSAALDAESRSPLTDDTSASLTGVLEEGNIYFVYRPKVQKLQGASNINDVQRLYLVLVPKDKHVYRDIVVGRKRLPEIKSHQAFWAFCEVVGDQKDILHQLEGEEYDTKTRGKRHLPDARAVAEGKYQIVKKDERKSYLTYEVDDPEELGELQDEFNICRKASYVINVKNPEAGQPSWAGLDTGQKATYPNELRSRFRQQRYAALEPEFLDYVGCEMIMIGAREGEDIPDEILDEPETKTASSNLQKEAPIKQDLPSVKTEHMEVSS